MDWLDRMQADLIVVGHDLKLFFVVVLLALWTLRNCRRRDLDHKGAEKRTSLDESGGEVDLGQTMDWLEHTRKDLRVVGHYLGLLLMTLFLVLWTL